MRVAVIVFARMSSRRLPGKMLADIGGRPLLGRVLDRARRIADVDALVVATSREADDDAIAAFAEAEAVAVCRGALADVCDRACQCAREHALDALVRVCGDRPFFDPDEASTQVAIWRTAAAAGDPPDLVSNLLAGPVAPGLTCETVATSALDRVLARSGDPEDREHLTRHLYAHPDRFRLVATEPRFSLPADQRFVVDTVDDLERTRCVVARLPDPASAALEQIASFSRACVEGAATGASHA